MDSNCTLCAGSFRDIVPPRSSRFSIPVDHLKLSPHPVIFYNPLETVGGLCMLGTEKRKRRGRIKEGGSASRFITGVLYTIRLNRACSCSRGRCHICPSKSGMSALSPAANYGYAISLKGETFAVGQGLMKRTSFAWKEVEGEMVQVPNSRTESMPKEAALCRHHQQEDLEC